MLGTHNSIFDSPSFIQRIMKKKSSSKYNIRPPCTADILADQCSSTKYSFHQQKKTKTYNYHSQNTAPVLVPSISSTTTSSLSDSVIIVPMPSSSTPTIKQQRKRPLSSEILIKIMDQRLLKKQQLNLQQLQQQQVNTQLNRSVSTSTTMNNTNTAKNTFPAPRLNKLLPNKPVTTISPSTMRHNSDARKPKQQENTNTMRRQQQSKKLMTNKSMLNKLQIITEWPYVLKQDNDEQDRMVAQHYLLRTAFGGDFSSPIRPALQKGIVVLDVGCGSGVWTMEMSTAFPKSTFIGIDQGSFYPRDIKPRNCHFRSCDALVQHQLPLPFPDNSIDYIYQRDMNWGITGQIWQPLLQEYQRILKPGGWIEFVEPDLETQNSLENECSMNDKLITGLTMRQQDPYAVHRLPTMLSINGFRRVQDFSQSFPLGWGTSHSGSTTTNSSIIDQEKQIEDQEEQEISNCSQTSASSCASSESATSSNSFCPQQTKETHTTNTCSEFARAMSSQYLFLLKSLRPWLSAVMNLSYEKYDDYIAGLPAEWKRAQTYINWHCIVAQKPLHS